MIMSFVFDFFYLVQSTVDLFVIILYIQYGVEDVKKMGQNLCFLLAQIVFNLLSV